MPVSIIKRMNSSMLTGMPARVLLLAVVLFSPPTILSYPLKDVSM